MCTTSCSHQSLTLWLVSGAAWGNTAALVTPHSSNPRRSCHLHVVVRTGSCCICCVQRGPGSRGVAGVLPGVDVGALPVPLRAFPPSLSHSHSSSPAAQAAPARLGAPRGPLSPPVQRQKGQGEPGRGELLMGGAEFTLFALVFPVAGAAFNPGPFC